MADHCDLYSVWTILAYLWEVIVYAVLVFIVAHKLRNVTEALGVKVLCFQLLALCWCSLLCCVSRCLYWQRDLAWAACYTLVLCMADLALEATLPIGGQPGKFKFKLCFLIHWFNLILLFR